jgi:hypothetical protein
MPAQKPVISATATALAQYLGMQTIGKKGASVAWALPPIMASQFAPFNGVPIGVPGMVNNFDPTPPWALFDLNPTVQSGSYDFGTAFSFHIAISRVKLQVASDVNYYVPGRVIVFDPDLNQAYLYFAKDVVPSVVTTITIQHQGAFAIYESENGDGQICVKQGSALQVWVEMDNYSTTGPGGANFGTLTSAIITMYNFER